MMSVLSSPLPGADPLHRACANIREGRLDEEELRILRFLERKVPELTGPFESSIFQGRKATLNRLATSMLQEDLVGVASVSYDLRGIDSFRSIDAPAIERNRQEIAESLQASDSENGKSYKVCPLPKGEYLILSTDGSYAFRRLEVEGPILHVGLAGFRRLQHAVELLQLARWREIAADGSTRNAWLKLAQELRNGSANLALAYAYYEDKKKRLQKVASEHGAETTLDLVASIKAQDRSFDSSLFFEQLCTEGHQLHVGAKTKIGMEPDAVHRYAPELQGAPDIRFVGIRRDYAGWSTVKDGDADAVLFEEYPELREAVATEFATEKGLPAAEYLFVPVHSWQMERSVPRIYENELAQGIVVPVESVSIPSRATSSFRTVVPCAGEGRTRLAVKTSVDSQMTSTVRSISANTAQNGAEFTRLILTVMRREPQLVDTFVPVCEVAGFNFEVDATERDPKARTAKSRNLSALLRENVESFVKPDELAVVASSLYSESPITGKPILVELVERYAKSTGEESLRTAALRFVFEYATVALPGFLKMMVKYGIGLEGHLQNSVPVFRHGRPVRMLFRDWGGARIYVERLEQRGLSLNLYPNSVTVTEDLKEMHDKVFYTVFQNQMAEIILLTCKHLEVPERELWREVYRISEGVFASLMSCPEHAEDASQDREALYEANVNCKALTTMRLSTGEGYCYAPVPNPLHEFYASSKAL